MTSFGVHYKKVNVGYCGKLSKVRERGLTAASVGGGKGGGLVLENEMNTAGLLVNKKECSVGSCVSFFLRIHLYHPLTRCAVEGHESESMMSKTGLVRLTIFGA